MSDPVTSPGPAVSDIVTLVDQRALSDGERPAWTFEARDGSLDVVTFADVARRSRVVASALARQGVAAGTPVGVMLGNRAEFALTWFALMRLGAPMVPLNPHYGPRDLAHVLDDSGAGLVVVWPEDLGRLESLADGVTPADLEGDSDHHDEPVEPAPTGLTVVNLQYTSGTTGAPKACLLTHDYWLRLAGSLVDGFPRLHADDVLLTAQPFHYVDPQWNVIAGLLAGAHVVVLDGFHPSTFWERVRSHQVTYFYCLAAMPGLLLAMPPDTHDREHRVRAVQCSAIPTSRHAEIESRWGVPWFEAFGMTETGADIRVGAEEHDELVGTGCLGRPAAHREARIVDGQLFLRGPGMMLGYHGHPSPFDDDGWFATGDLARTDDRGRYYLTGRLKDMIRRSGENIAAAEVEQVLIEHPAVQVVAVIGVPDELRGEEVKAFVVAPDADVEALESWCRERLAPFKVPRWWEFREELPMTPSHRVAKALLRESAPTPHEASA